MGPLDILAGIKRMPSEIIRLLGLMREKGFFYYRRLLFLAFVPLIVIYFTVYKGSTVKFEQAQKEISLLGGVVRYASHYRDLQERLAAFNASLPNPKDKDRGRWLTDMVREAMKAEGVEPTSLSPASEQAWGGFGIVSMRVACKLSYRQLAFWIARMESSKYAVQVTRLDLAKDKSEIGMNDVQLVVQAVFPRDAETP